MKLTCFCFSFLQTICRKQRDATMTFARCTFLVVHAHDACKCRMRHRQIVIDAHINSMADVDYNKAQDDDKQRNENIRQYGWYVDYRVQHCCAS